MASSSSSLCLSCARRVSASSSSSSVSQLPTWTPSLTQVRGKHRLRASDLGTCVRLLKDVTEFGPKGAIFLTERGRMRNFWYPKGQAEYMTRQRFTELGLTKKDIGERRYNFGLARAASENEDGDSVRQQIPSARAPTSDRRPAPVVEQIALDRAHDLLASLLPETLTFYRKANRVTLESATQETPTIASRPRSPLLASRAAISKAADTDSTQTETPASPVEPIVEEPTSVPIFGSVSTTDIAQLAKEMMLLDTEAARIPLDAKHVRFLGEDEGADRVRALGKWEVEISLAGDLQQRDGAGEIRPVNRTVIVAEED